MSAPNLLIVTNPSNWKLQSESVQIVAAKDYLTDPSFQSQKNAKVFNLCRSYAYQSLGYYVSLLAEARGQRVIPSVATMGDFRSSMVAQSFGEEIPKAIQSALAKVQENKFQLQVIFGQSFEPQFKSLALQLYRLFPAPLLTAYFSKSDKGWQLDKVSPLSMNSFVPEKRSEVEQLAQNYFNQPRFYKPRKSRFIYDLAIAVNPNEKAPPSDAKALQRFQEAAEEIGFFVEQITTEDMHRINEFDALFIRETTAVNKPIYQLSRLAFAEGLIVIDDPWSILRSTNKIYLAELLNREKIPTPKTRVFTKEDLKVERLAEVKLPCVLKLPDGAFSLGVHKVKTTEELESTLRDLLKESELILAQEFMPSDYDWRIGVLDGEPLYACKYFMAKGHWQIYNWNAPSKKTHEGDSECVAIPDVPPVIIETALKSANLIGDGLYGVDIKEVSGRAYVIEVNDNASLEAGVEDELLGQELYRKIAQSFKRRIEFARGQTQAGAKT